MAASPRRLSARLGMAVAAACWLLLAAGHATHLFYTLDLKLTDSRFRFRGPRVASDRIALVEIDDETVHQFGRWPLRREFYAALLSVCDSAGAAAVGFDVQFLDPGDDALGDTMLAMVSAETPVVHAMSFRSEAAGDAGGPSDTDSIASTIANHGVVDPGLALPDDAGGRIPYAALAAATPALAHVSVATDTDGVVRRLPLLVQHAGRLYPALALRLATLADGDPAPPAVRPARGGAVVSWRGGHTLFVPVDGEGQTAIDYAGGARAFRNAHSMLWVLNRAREGRYDELRGVLGGKIVLVGVTAEGEVATDVGATPFSATTPLVFVHANALDAILGGRFMRPAPPAPYVAVLGLLALAMGIAFSWLALPVAAATAGAVTLVLAIANVALFIVARLDAPPTMSLLLAPFAYAAIASWRYVFLERGSRERDRELQVARRIQQKLLPVTPPAHPGLDIHGFNLPAQEIGGDYFDWIELEDGSLLLALGDVSGKGVGAALLMSHLHASLHAEARAGREPVEIVTAMHRSLSRAVESGKFATFFLARIIADNGRLTYCSAGHNPALLVRDGRHDLLGATGLPLAMIEEMTYEQVDRTLEPGDVLIVHSDGVTDCEGKGGMYGEERLYASALRRAASEAASAGIAKGILTDASTFCRGDLGADDFTVLVAKR